MLRIRRGWRQLDVGIKASLSAAAIGRQENGILGSLHALEVHAAVFGLRLDVRLLGRAGELTRLSDEEHAALVETAAAAFRQQGFLTETEASFSEWGERGRIDLLALNPRSGMLVIVEAKTQLLDLQDLFGALNVKERLAPSVAGHLGWQVRRRVTILWVAATSANREVVRAHPTLFAGFAVRRFGALSEGRDARVLCWIAAVTAARPAWIAGRQRVRPRRRQHLSPRADNPTRTIATDPFDPLSPGG
jgi:transcriptional regulator with XRE-family HTH domain